MYRLPYPEPTEGTVLLCSRDHTLAVVDGYLSHEDPDVIRNVAAVFGIPGEPELVGDAPASDPVPDPAPDVAPAPEPDVHTWEAEGGSPAPTEG